MESFEIVHAEESREGLLVSFNRSEIVKKYEAAPLEVNLYRIPAESGFSIDCPPTAEAAKTYYLLSGRCRHLESGRELVAGDLLVVRRAEEYHNLYALEDSALLVHAVNMEAYAVARDSVAKVSAVLDAIQAKDAYTKDHSDRVFALVYALSLRLGYSGKRLFNLLRAARYHDVGKVRVDGAVLTKPARLDPAEYEAMKGHVAFARDFILEALGEEIFAIVALHHERVDGSGYPLGLRGADIPEEGRLLALCDSYDAMTTDRVYRPAMAPAAALAELRRSGGYDLRLLGQLEEVLERRAAKERQAAEEARG